MAIEGEQLTTIEKNLTKPRKATRGASGKKNVKNINLALQGGGSHGAFTWGVLDRLLEDERLEIGGISGTSAGAMNGAALIQGYYRGGRDGARQTLDFFWNQLAGISWMSPVHRTPWDRLTGNWNTDNSPWTQWIDAMSQFLSPYMTNRGRVNPLRDILSEHLDLEALRSAQKMQLFVSATNVRTGGIRVFSGEDLSVEALLASACLPTSFQAVIIDGDPYWDGGYRGNPALFPLYDCHSSDIMIVQINPLERDDVPDTSAEIMNRLNEITFNGALRSEIRAIAFVQKLIAQDNLKGKAVDRLRLLHMHMIDAEKEMQALGGTSKFNTDKEFLLYLKELGRRQADRWLQKNFAALGRHSSIDLKKAFL